METYESVKSNPVQPEQKEKKKGGAWKGIVAVILAAGVVGSTTISAFNLVTLKSYIAEQKKEENPETTEDYVKIADNYEIKPTTNISDAYKSGDTSKLTDKEKETLDMAKKAIKDMKITDSMSDFEKEKAVYDWMTKKLQQDSGALGIVVGGAVFFVTSGILRPLRQLYNATGEISEGNFAVRTHVKSHDEVAVLAHGFNDMAENIQILVNKVREDEQKMRKADLRLLQEQINPHFLYNTLDTIVWLIECNETEQATEMVVTLSDFFRLVLSHGQEFISIRMEEQHVRSYLQIQETRYHDIMEYHILIDPELYGYQIPKMTLQPIVENALYHGIKCKRSKGQICIRGEKKQDLLILTVTDDGVGMEEADLQDLQKEIEKPCKQTDRGFGLANVNERLHMYFGAEYGVKIASRPGEGTQVTIVIPAVHNVTGEAIT